jgi:hypothetical protein
MEPFYFTEQQRARVSTPREEFARMVLRVTALMAGTTAGYTPAIRSAEARLDELARRYDVGELTRRDVSVAISALEELWAVEIAKARRQRSAG